MSSSHQGVPDHGGALTTGLFVGPFLYLVFSIVYKFNQNVFIKATIDFESHWWFSRRILTYPAGGRPGFGSR